MRRMGMGKLTDLIQADKDTEELFESQSNLRFAAIPRVALRKLIQLITIDDTPVML